MDQSGFTTTEYSSQEILRCRIQQVAGINYWFTAKISSKSSSRIVFTRVFESLKQKLSVEDFNELSTENTFTPFLKNGPLTSKVKKLVARF